ncbi:MAG: aquaporin, partial [Buchnera aphidicola]|nr:aquaporin [Buchnera aphidicola]
VSISIYFSYKISGAHLNPALTIFLWLSSQLHQEKVLPYIISQISGAFFFTMLFYFFDYNILIAFEKKHEIIRGTKNSLELASIFCAFPKNN